MPKDQVLLLVEDHVPWLELLSQALSRDHEVVPCQSPGEAGDVLKDLLPDLIILDLAFLPTKGEGVSFLRLVRGGLLGKALQNVKVLVVTNHDEYETECRELSVSGFLIKPVRLAALRAAVREALGSYG